ncbi:MAG: tyrosine-type recombinase/integrase [Bacteroidota bacterium]
MDFSIYPFKRYGKIRLYVRFEDHYDNEITRSTGISYLPDATDTERKQSKQEATKKAKQIVQEYFEEHQLVYQEPTQNPRLSNYLEQDYWPYVESNCSEGTYERYQTNLGHFLRICKDRPMDAYKRIDIERFKQKRLSEVSKETINVDIRGIKAAFSWAYKYNLIDRHPFKGQDFLFEVNSRKRAFTKKEVDRLLDYTEGENIGLAIRLAYYTGMRIGEVSGLTWNFVHLGDNPFLHIPKELAKNNKARDIPLGEKALEIVQALKRTLEQKKQKNPAVYKNRPPEETYLIQKKRGWGQYCIRSIQDRFSDVRDEAGLPDELTFHCLRHSFATHILAKNANLFGVSKLLGHSDTKITQDFYDHTSGLNFREIADMI